MIDRRRFLVRGSAAALAPFAGASHAKTAADPSPAMIDAHVHVYRSTPEFPFAPGAKVPERDFPAETLLELMRANGVSRTVLIQIIHYKWDNSYLHSVLKRYPEIFQGVCRVNPEDPDAPDHLAQLVADGFHGVRLSPAATAEGDWIRGALMKPLWRRCAQLRVPMTLLVPTSRLPDLVPLIEANPDLDIVIDHMAECPLDEPGQFKLLTDLARYSRVYVKISELWTVSKTPYPYPDTQDRVRRLCDAFGSHRLMWATNWPVSLQKLTYAQAVDLYRDHMPYLSREEHQDILFRTVQRLWPFHIA